MECQSEIHLLNEFRQFAMRGNVVDMAVGIIVGGGFGRIVSSLVNDVVMPPVGVVLGGVDFRNLAVTLRSATENVPAVTLNYGTFANTTIEFVIVAFAIFLFVRLINRLRHVEKASEPTTKACPECRMNIPIDATRCGHCTSPVLHQHRRSHNSTGFPTLFVAERSYKNNYHELHLRLGR